MIWIPNGFRADSKRIPFAYIRNVTLRNATSLYVTDVVETSHQSSSYVPLKSVNG